MARNIEIKARARAFDELRERAAALSPDAPLIFRQLDCFYDVPAADSNCASSKTAHRPS